MIHQYAFNGANSQNNFFSKASVMSENQLALQTSLFLDDTRFDFLTTLQYDGSDFNALILCN